MNRKEENINLLIVKVVMICLFLIIIFTFKSTDYSDKYSFCQCGRITHVIDVDMSVNIDKSTIHNNSATLSSPVSSPNIAACEIFTFNICNKNNFLFICSNNTTNQLFKYRKKLFLVIKPLIFEFDSHPIRASLNNEFISLIS
jgi:hypothetical protein